MRYILLSLFAFFPILGFSQFGLGNTSESDKIVTWKFSVKPVSEGVYLFTASAQIGKGFHIFHLDAGGDGTLIATEINIEGSEEEDAAQEWQVTPAPKIVQIDIIEGDIYWHEKSVSFSKEFKVATHQKTLNGEVYFQVCNEEKCLPPAIKKFELSL